MCNIPSTYRVAGPLARLSRFFPPSRAAATHSLVLSSLELPVPDLVYAVLYLLPVYLNALIRISKS